MSKISALISDISFKLVNAARVSGMRAGRAFLPGGGHRPGFFDQYPRFFETSVTTATANRLNERHRAIIEANRDAIAGARVLDIASHDGRWTFAAMRAGAKSVIGIEARKHLIEASNENLKEFGGAHRFLLGDAYDLLDRIEPGSIDTVMCLGFFYHVTDHMLLLSKIERLKARNLIIDTAVSADVRPVVLFQHEEHELESDATKTSDAQKIVLAGIPSKAALDMMLSSFGWKPRYYDWHKAGIASWQQIEDYQEGTRVTLRA
jgi:precorrin-6B methylase 2